MTAWQGALVVVCLLVLGLAALASAHTRQDRRRRELAGKPRPWALPIIRGGLAARRDFDKSFDAVCRLLETDPARDALLRTVADRVRREILDPERKPDERVPTLWGRSPLASLGKPIGKVRRVRERHGGIEVEYTVDAEFALRAAAGDALAHKLDAELLGIDTGTDPPTTHNCRCVYPELADGLDDDERTRWLLGVGVNEVAELARLYELDADEVDQ